MKHAKRSILFVSRREPLASREGQADHSSHRIRTIRLGSSFSAVGPFHFHTIHFSPGRGEVVWLVRMCPRNKPTFVTDDFGVRHFSELALLRWTRQHEVSGAIRSCTAFAIENSTVNRNDSVSGNRVCNVSTLLDDYSNRVVNDSKTSVCQFRLLPQREALTCALATGSSTNPLVDVTWDGKKSHDVCSRFASPCNSQRARTLPNLDARRSLIFD
jgi:hypothetical protein